MFSVFKLQTKGKFNTERVFSKFSSQLLLYTGLDEIRKRKDHHRHRISELSCSIIELFTRRKEQQNN